VVSFKSAPTGEDSERDLKLLAMVALCATMVTIKLSGLVFAALVLMVLITAFRRVLSLEKLVVYGLLASLIGIPHLFRGYFLSGAPLFPSTFGSILTFEWAMSSDAIRNTADWVYCWARRPGPECMSALGNWGWLPDWWAQFSFRIKVLVGGSVTLILLSILGWHRARTGEGLAFLYLCCVVNLLTIAFWFFTAPDQRFLGSIPYTFLAISLMTFFWAWGSSLDQLMVRLEPAIKVFVVLVFIFFSYRYALVSFSSPRAVLVEGFQPFASDKLKLRETDRGLLVYQPTSGDRCFDAPLPCAPGFDSRLQLIENTGRVPRYYFTRKDSDQ